MLTFKDPRFVEYETAADLRTAVEKLDGREFKGNRVQCVADVSSGLLSADKAAFGRKEYLTLTMTDPSGSASIPRGPRALSFTGSPGTHAAV